MTLTVRNIIISVVSVVVAAVGIVIGAYFLHKRNSNPERNSNTDHRARVYWRSIPPSRATSPGVKDWPSSSRSTDFTNVPLDSNSTSSQTSPPSEENDKQSNEQKRETINITAEDNPPLGRPRSKTIV